jgi:hypothetical protein
MKTINYLFCTVLISFLVSCFGNTKDQNYYDESEPYPSEINNLDTNEFSANNYDNLPQRINNNQDIKWFDVKNTNTGLVSESIPFPSSWRQVTNSREYTFEGPNNLKVSGTFGKHFTYNSPTAMYGATNTPPMNIQQIIDTYFMPVAQQTNRKLLTKYELPAHGNKMLQYQNQLWEYMPSRKTVKAYGIEWQDSNNMKYITLLYISNNQSSMGSNWGFFGNYLQARSQDFEVAKNAYLKGIEKTRYNPQQIAMHNQNEMRKAGIRNSIHQQRMAAIKARGNAILNTGKIYSEISDISHAGYLNRNNINSHGHTKTISGINETVTIANHNSGEHYSVPMGNKHYWVAGDGTYFGTDNSLYNPNTDQKLYDKNWTQFEIEQ